MSTELDPRFVFDRFVVGPANRLAASAARRAAQSPGSSYNPLVVCGPAGLGKTHLLKAVGHLARSVEPELYVHYETVDSFVDRLTSAISAGTVEEFREATSRMGLLLLDDLQEVVGKGRTQEELLLTWQTMLERGSQVVVVADRAPHEIQALDPRLAALLADGLIVDIAPPESETRLRILRQLIEERGAELDADVVQAMGRVPMENVRDLEAALETILTIASGDTPVQPADVPALLGAGVDRPGGAATEFGDFLTDISTAVAAVVETAPWRKRIAQAILRWEGEGVRTRRLEEALDADSAPDVDALLTAFGRDVARLREIGRELPMPPGDPLLLGDPDRLHEAEALLARARSTSRPSSEPPRRRATAARDEGPASPDSWFLDREKLAWDWIALDERIVEEPA